jgi:hypothetical protein
MRWCELLGEVKPSGGIGGVAPLTPKQARVRKGKQDKAGVRVRDVQAANAVRVAAAQHKAAEV